MRIYPAAPQNFVALMGDVSPQDGNVMESLIAKIKVMRAQTCVVSKQKNKLLLTYSLKICFFFFNLITRYIFLIPLFLVERTCGPEEWACKSKSGQCIPNAWVCDDHEDCDDKSDEEVCSKFNTNQFWLLFLSHIEYLD